MSIDMSQHFTFGTLLKYVAPSIRTLLLTSVYGIVDGLFVSNFAGKTAFAAVNFIMPIIMILAPIGLMVGTGGNAVVSKTRGEGNGELANRQFSLLVYFNLFCGIAMAIMGFLLIPIIAGAMGATGEMLELCVTYGRISMLSLPFFMMQLAFQAFSATAGKPNLSLKVAIAAGVTNIALDFILVGALHMGVVGAALATVASEYVGGGACLVYFALPNKSFLRLGKTSLDLKTIGRTCVNGSSEMMSNIALSVVSVAYNLQLMRYIGPDGVAAYGVIMYCGLVFGSFFIGYSIGSAPLMAFQYGARKHREMRNLLKKGLTIIAVGGIAMYAIAETAAPLIAKIFASYDEGLYQLTTFAFRAYSISFLLMGFSIYASSLFTSLCNGKVSALISFLRTLVFELGAVMILPALLGANGIWFSVVVAEVVSICLASACFAKLAPRYHLLPERRAQG